MLTVKRVYAHGDYIHTASSVRFIAKTDEKCARVVISKENGSTDTFIDGTIYVMNENGQTVSKYILGHRDPTFVA